MSEITRETVTTTTNVSPDNSTVVRNTEVKGDGSSFTTQNLIYFIFGILEFLLIFRFIFRLMGANPGSPFVAFIYGITAPFIAPFSGIFRSAVTEGVETTSVLEPATLIAVMVYALLSWGIVKLIAITSGDPEV